MISSRISTLRLSSSTRSSQTTQGPHTFLPPFIDHRGTPCQLLSILPTTSTCRRLRRKETSSPISISCSAPSSVSAKDFQHNFFCAAFATTQFTKAYYPYGIIVRRSVPTTPLKQASYFGPMIAFFTYAWWMHKEHPRKYRLDLTSDDE